MALPTIQERQEKINELAIKIVFLKEDLKEVIRKDYNDTAMRVIVVQLLRAEESLKNWFLLPTKEKRK